MVRQAVPWDFEGKFGRSYIFRGDFRIRRSGTPVGRSYVPHRPANGKLALDTTNGPSVPAEDRREGRGLAIASSHAVFPELRPAGRKAPPRLLPVDRLGARLRGRELRVRTLGIGRRVPVAGGARTGYDHVRVRGEDLWLGTKRMRIRPKVPRKRRTNRFPIRSRKRETRPGEWLESFDGTSLCSYPPEDVSWSGSANT